MRGREGERGRERQIERKKKRRVEEEQWIYKYMLK